LWLPTSTFPYVIVDFLMIDSVIGYCHREYFSLTFHFLYYFHLAAPQIQSTFIRVTC
jgi:hypothetical protein